MPNLFNPVADVRSLQGQRSRKPYFYLLSCFWGAAFCCLLPACGGADAPLDADTRQKIDSISAAQIRAARLELDTLCKIQRSAQLPHLVDSIRQIRLRQIEKQMQTVPR